MLLEKTLIDQEIQRLVNGIGLLKQQLQAAAVLSESTGWNRKANVLMAAYSCVSLHH